MLALCKFSPCVRVLNTCFSFEGLLTKLVRTKNGLLLMGAVILSVLITFFPRLRSRETYCKYSYKRDVSETYGAWASTLYT